MLYPLQNDRRNKMDLSGIWDFQIDPEQTGEVHGWVSELPSPRPIAVPGSWNSQYADLFNYFDLGWYVTNTFVPLAWKGERIYIRVGSACYFAEVYMNGEKVGSHEGGHLPFEFDVTSQVRFGEENTIAICVENLLLPTRVPSGNVKGTMDASSITAGYPSTTFDFFPFAGLHRPVILYSVPLSHISDITVITRIDGSDGLVEINVKTNGDIQTARISIKDAHQSVVCDMQSLSGVAETTLNIPNAKFWSHSNPHLYDLDIRTETDHYTLKIGIRTIKVDGHQLLLNNKPIQLNGFGRHEDFYASGKGLNLPLLIKDYQLMRWTGAVSYRTSHYPYSEEEMMLADREGFLIIDETPAVHLKFENPDNIKARYRMAQQQLDELITRDKNHPSVIMWSVANEPMPSDMLARFTYGEVDEDLTQLSKDVLHNLITYAREHDSTRPVTLAAVMGSPLDWLEACDVVCINRYWGWYINGGQMDKGLEQIDQELDGLWQTLRKPIMVTEFGADAQPGLHGHPGLMWTEEYQADIIRGYLEIASEKPFVVGMQVWNFADFAAVQSITRVGGMNMKGVFTRSRQPKLAAHVIREIWSKRTSEDTQGNKMDMVLESENITGTDITTSEILSILESLIQKIKQKMAGITTTLKFDFYNDGIYRMTIDKGSCTIENSDGLSDATIQLTVQDFQKLLEGKLDPMIAMMTGRIKTKGDARAFMMLLD